MTHEPCSYFWRTLPFVSLVGAVSASPWSQTAFSFCHLRQQLCKRPAQPASCRSRRFSAAMVQEQPVWTLYCRDSYAQIARRLLALACCMADHPSYFPKLGVWLGCPKSLPGFWEVWKLSASKPRESGALFGLSLVIVIDLVEFSAIWIGALLNQFAVAMDVDVEVFVELEHAFENALLFFNGNGWNIKLIS